MTSLLIGRSRASTIDALICPALSDEWVQRAYGDFHAYRPCRPDAHPYQWQAWDVYDRAASGADVVAYLDMGIDCTESLVPPPINLTRTPLYRAAIALIQSRHPRGFLIVPDSSWQWGKRNSDTSTLHAWYRSGGYKTITDFYVLTIGARIGWRTERKIQRSCAARVTVIDPTTITEGRRDFTITRAYMPKPRKETFYSIPIAVPDEYPLSVSLRPATVTAVCHG